MSVIQGEVISGGSQGYEIPQSLRFNDDDSAYLSRTPSVAGNRKTWTFSTWVKRGNLGINETIFGAGVNGGAYTLININSSDKLYFLDGTGSSNPHLATSDMLLRDTSSWYNVICVVNTTLATASDRVKFYINGNRIAMTETATYTQNYDTNGINNTVSHKLGLSSYNDVPFDGYLAETHFIDGQALTPDYFGEFDATYGHWKPIAYEGTYGTNGFYLDNSGLGTDASGNGNNFTATNLSATDIVLDSPTNNYATLNLLYKLNSKIIALGYSTLSEGNTKASGVNTEAYGTIINSSGKIYFEAMQGTTGANANGVGFYRVGTSEEIIYRDNGNFAFNGSQSAYGASWQTATDVIGVALDIDAGTIEFYKNGVSQGIAKSDLVGGEYSPFIYVRSASSSSANIITNFGQDSSFAGNKTAQGYTDANGIGDFYYEPPAGYLALCTANLPEPTVVPSEHFDVVTYNGNGISYSETSLLFSPDFIWGKSRNNVYESGLFDIVRGVTNVLGSNTTEAEKVRSGVTSFDTNGFTVGNWSGMNDATYTYVAWNWKAGGTPVTNNDGTITSQVSANVDAGFSIVSYTGNAVAGTTVGHGLNQAIDLYFVKARTGVTNWAVLGKALNDAAGGGYRYLLLNTTNAWGTASQSYGDSETIELWSDDTNNSNGTDYIAYCFHSVEGYSKIGSYTGNGSADGTFVYCNHKPKYIMIKRTDSTGSWSIFDTERSTFNVVEDWLGANYSYAEGPVANALDITSSGFKLRTTNGDLNASGGTYLFYAVAESPLKFSNAR